MRSLPSPSAVSPPEWLLVVEGHFASEFLHQGAILLRPGFGLTGRVSGAGTVWSDEIHPNDHEVLTEVGLADVATVRCGDQSMRIEHANQFPKFFQIRKAREPLVLD